MNENRIIKTEYSDMMQKSYINYAMSVIISRAIPDIRDGLKPVQRRILYDMHELGLKHNMPHRKSARIVGDTMGKYHPHGDASIYDALVVMAQDFKKGIPLVDGHGNFGSIEGDPEAASRYTESRLTKIAQDVYLSDLDKNVVDFVPNFDASEKEPEVLPVRIPNLLINGSEGIAVGMTTSTPTHNLGEVIDAAIAYINNNDLTVEDLLQHIKGPDFPTGGIISNKDELLNIYETGMGKIKIRGKIDIEESRGGKKRLVITEIPYTMIGTGISRLLNDIAALSDLKLTNDITDISNQSSKEGVRIVLDLKKDANINHIIALLYKKTKLEDTFGVNMLSVVDGRPETLGIKDIIAHHVKFQEDIMMRKYQTLLQKERVKKEIQDGLMQAVDLIDVIIEIFRGSRTVNDAKECLMHGATSNVSFRKKSSEKIASTLHFTEKQAQAILEMRLQKLIGLELSALQQDQSQTIANIQSYERIISSKKEISKLIISDLKRIKQTYATPRKTLIENSRQIELPEQRIAEQELILLIDRFGYAHTIDKNTYEKNKTTISEEAKYIIHCSNIGKVCLFTNVGQMHQIKVADIPFGKLRDKGLPLDNVSNFNSEKEQIVFICDEKLLCGGRVLFTTRLGMMKQVDGSEFIVSKRTIAATKLQEDDSIVDMQLIANQNYIVLTTKNNVVLKFQLSEVPMKKKAAVGVRSIRLSANDEIANVYTYVDGVETKVIFKNKELTLNKLKTSKRDSVGSKK
jgi:DNA gyrase subunit A